ncbi:chloroplastic lipocalin-like [Nicotiana tabacum]|uniref:Chloroplastic lipocalin-like n=1 Tax=Nicotiana tabacum TaxID=4097 RepID=A0A1S4B0R7_TOBAC
MVCYNLVVQQSPPILLQSLYPSKPRGMPMKVMSGCCNECPISSKVAVKQVFSGLAASILFLSQSNLAFAADLPHYNSVSQLANAIDSAPVLPLEKGNDGGGGKLMMMRGMTAKDFDPIRYSGRWFEVASLKRGFAGQGQEDCHCTQGIYTVDMAAPAIQVDTFCVHGGPDGYITGIRGRVQCLTEEDREKNETDLERQEMIREKCYLRFPTLPFIPKEPYDVIATDYDNFALVSGAKDRSFIQIYSRTPNPGPKFIEKYKNYLGSFGYDPSQIKDTPQDCEVKSTSQLAAMMSMPGMQQALSNQFPDLELKAAVEFNPFTSVFETLKKLVELYFK